MFQENQQKNLNLLIVLRGKLTLGPNLDIPEPSLDRQLKYFLQNRYPTNFPWHHEKLDCPSTPTPLRSHTSSRSFYITAVFHYDAQQLVKEESKK